LNFRVTVPSLHITVLDLYMVILKIKHVNRKIWQTVLNLMQRYMIFYLW
jgi:hypothetical protein